MKLYVFYKPKAPYVKLRRVPRLFPCLFIYIHRHARLKFNSKFVLKDRNFLNQPSDKLLIVSGKSGGLLL